MKRAREQWREGQRWEAAKGFVRREWPVMAFVICFALIGVGVLRVQQLGEDNRKAVRVSCHLLNRAINQSTQGATARPTALLVAEIIEGMTPAERRAYELASAQAVTSGAQRNPCGQVADNAY